MRGATVVRGRNAEMTTLRQHVSDLRHSRGAVLLIEGAPGTGKSRLLDEAATLAREMTMRVGATAVQPEDSTIEFSTLLAALFDPRHPVLDRSAVAGIDAVADRRYWLADDLHALLRAAAAHAPIVVCIDDFQWSDSGTATALLSLPERLADLPIAWILSVRPGEGSHAVTTALDHLERVGARRLVLEALDAATVAQLATDILQAPPDRELLSLAAGVGGNPRLLVELLTGLRDEGSVVVRDGTAVRLHRRLPMDFRRTLREQLDGLSADARQVALVATALGRTFSFADLASMLQLPPAALLGPVGELISAGLIADAGEGLRFAHELVRDATWESIPSSTRQALGRQAVDVLSARGTLSIDVAGRFAAEAECDDDAIATLIQMAASLGSSEPAAAACLSARAVELMPPAHPLWGQAIAQGVSLLHAAGESGEGGALAQAALDEPRAAEQHAEVRLAVAGMFSISSDVRANAGWAALQLTELPPELSARHGARLACNLLGAGRTEQARVLIAQIESQVRAAGDPAACSSLELARSGLAYADGYFSEALRLAEAARRIPAGDDTWERVSDRWRCELLTVVGRFDDAVLLAADALAAATNDQQVWARHMLETWQGGQLLQRGEPARAISLLEGQFDVSAAGDFGAHEAAAVVALARAAIHTDDAAQSRRCAALAGQMLQRGSPCVQRHATWLLALQAMDERDPQLAHRWLSRQQGGGPDASEQRFPLDVTDDVFLVRVGLAVGDHALVNRAEQAVWQRAERNPGLTCIAAAAAHARGLAFDDARELEQAIELFAATPRILAQAAALEDLATLSAQDDGGPETNLLDRALVLYSEASATNDERRVRARLGSHGIRRRLVSTHRPDHGWRAMTGSETTVAELVATGLTNREVAQRLVVSPHTVSSHLRNVFSKLDVTSRGELALMARGHDKRS
jgi:DNA-binding CsgD family transcriptional regulator